MNIKFCKNCVVYGFAGALFGCGQPALDLEDTAKSLTKTDETLKKISTTNTINVGFAEDYPPFSYRSEAGEPIGYAIDISNHIIKQLKLQLNQPNLQVKYHSLEPQYMLTALNSGLIDFECSVNKNMGIEADTTFSVGFFVTSPKFLVNNKQVFHHYKDLKNQQIAVVSDSVYEKNLKRFIHDNQLNNQVTIHATTPKLLPNLIKEQPIDVVVNDRVFLEHLRFNLQNPEDWYITGDDKMFDVYGCTLRKSDDSFKKLIDDSLIELYASGSIYQLYNKWFKSPLPNSGINMNYLLSVQNAELFAKPYDTPTPDDIVRATGDISKAFNVDSKEKK